MRTSVTHILSVESDQQLGESAATRAVKSDALDPPAALHGRVNREVVQTVASNNDALTYMSWASLWKTRSTLGARSQACLMCVKTLCTW